MREAIVALLTPFDLERYRHAVLVRQVPVGAFAACDARRWCKSGHAECRQHQREVKQQGERPEAMHACLFLSSGYGLFVRENRFDADGTAKGEDM